MKKWLSEFTEARIYVEANIFIYNALAHPRYGKESKRFLERALSGEFEAITSTLTLDEVAIVALTEKLEEKYKITKNKVTYLKRHPGVVKSLAKEVNSIVENILLFVTIEEVTPLDLQDMERFMNSYGLLPRDAIHLSVAHRLGLKDIATQDPDFERVEWLTVYRPKPASP